MVGSAEDKKRALSSLRADSGLQLLLPHFCAFIQTKVSRSLMDSGDGVEGGGRAVGMVGSLANRDTGRLNMTRVVLMGVYFDTTEG